MSDYNWEQFPRTDQIVPLLAAVVFVVFIVLGVTWALWWG